MPQSQLTEKAKFGSGNFKKKKKNIEQIELFYCYDHEDEAKKKKLEREAGNKYHHCKRKTTSTNFSFSLSVHKKWGLCALHVKKLFFCFSPSDVIEALIRQRRSFISVNRGYTGILQSTDQCQK